MPFSLTSDGRSSLSNLFNSPEHNSDNLQIERDNLLCVFKLVIKDLLNSSLRHERLLEKEYFPLRHFFIVFEQILFHGYLGKKTFSISSSANKKDLWPVIDLVSRKSTDTRILEISTSSKEMTNIRTSLGRVRAWLRLALMQKRLADYFKILVEQKQELNELYDNDALLLSDEIIIISGLLVGLNVLDFNFCLKETILDYPVESTIQYSLYLRERRLSSYASKNTHPPGAIQAPVDELDDYSSLSSVSSSPATGTSGQNDDTVVISSTNDIISIDESNTDIPYDQRVSSIIDQKNYVEELNRMLQKTVTDLQKRVQAYEETNKSLIDDVIIQKTRIERLHEDLAKLTSEKEQIQSSFQRKIDTLNADIDVERETYKKSQSGLDSIYKELQRKYENECVSKQKIENVYQSQLCQNTDFIESTRSMGKDIEEKTTLNDRLKADNNLLLEKLQIEQTRNGEKERQIQTVEKENTMLRETIEQLETNIDQINKENRALGDTNDSINRALAKSDAEKTSLETDLQVEQESYQRLQKALTNEKDKVSTLQFDVHELNLIKHEYKIYKTGMTKKQNDFETQLQEQEKTIEELALKLEEYIKREDDSKEKDGVRSSTWSKDENVKECYQCKKDFNTFRRKHHCRKCGLIFCETCVSTKLALSTSTKPVRVCDNCCALVLAQCVVNT